MPDGAHQKIQGVKVTPKNASTKRFPQWGVSEAFGGWIFSSNVQVGFSDAPTEIKLDIVLENDAQDLNSLIPKTFDIGPDDLRCDAGAGGSQNEHLFDISIGGTVFGDFILSDYSISLAPEQKTLSVVFKDYSIILDKIYVGLLKRQGAAIFRIFNAKGYFPVACPECDFRITVGNGTLYRDIAYGSYVGINGKIYDNFPFALSLYDAWGNLGSQKLSPSFDLNGGYLILGTEEMYENQCEDLPTISYTFRDLINSLSARGFSFEGVFYEGLANNPYYKQTYIGSLREVLNNWASDLGFQFYASGKTLKGINLNKEIDIKDIVNIVDPKSTLGKSFDGKNIAIGSYTESNTLNNTYRQAVIVSNTSQRSKREESFDIKNFVKLIPMHPLDFLVPNYTTYVNSDHGIFSQSYFGRYIANRFGTSDVNKTILALQDRTFDEIDTAMALAKYDDVLRDIYVGQKLREAHETRYNIASSPLTVSGAAKDEQKYSNALGFSLVSKITDLNAKSLILDTYLGENNKEVSYHPDFYDVYLGYYYQDAHKEIVDFEKNAADSMYKYATVNRGTIPDVPFVQEDISTFKNSNDEYYIQKAGLTIQVKNTFQPSAEKYGDLSEAPYYNLLPNRVTPFEHEKLYVASIENEWGTLSEDFKSGIYDPLIPNCDKSFNNIASIHQLSEYGNYADEIPKKQAWDLKIFAPTFWPDLSKVYTQVAQISELSPQTEDELNISYAGLDGKYRKDCKKMHICIIPNTKTHPNIRVSFEKKGYYSSVNKQLANQINKRLEKAQKDANNAINKHPDICDVSAIQTACNQIISCENQDNSANLYIGWPTYYFSSGSGQFLTGVPGSVAPSDYNQGSLGKDARTLTVNVTRNPIPGIDGQGSDGSYFYSQVLLEDIDARLQTVSSSATIVYPVCNDPIDYSLSYIGVLDAQVKKDLKVPSSWDIYGAPVNISENNTLTSKIINQTLPNDIKSIINPETMKPVRFTIVNTGNGSQVLSSVFDYYNIVSSLNSYHSTFPNKTVEFSVIGSPNLLDSTMSGYIDPAKGLNNFNMTIKDQGVETSFSFSNKPPVLPKQELIINSIGPRMSTFTV
jgi:hypothetical protein